jgi:hypothetical protein
MREVRLGGRGDIHMVARCSVMQTHFKVRDEITKNINCPAWPIESLQVANNREFCDYLEQSHCHKEWRTGRIQILKYMKFTNTFQARNDK